MTTLTAPRLSRTTHILTLLNRLSTNRIIRLKTRQSTDLVTTMSNLRVNDELVTSDIVFPFGLNATVVDLLNAPEPSSPPSQDASWKHSDTGVVTSPPRTPHRQSLSYLYASPPTSHTSSSPDSIEDLTVQQFFKIPDNLFTTSSPLCVPETLFHDEALSDIPHHPTFSQDPNPFQSQPESPQTPNLFSPSQNLFGSPNRPSPPFFGSPQKPSQTRFRSPRKPFTSPHNLPTTQLFTASQSTSQVSAYTQYTLPDLLQNLSISPQKRRRPSLPSPLLSSPTKRRINNNDSKVLVHGTPSSMNSTLSTISRVQTDEPSSPTPRPYSTPSRPSRTPTSTRTPASTRILVASTPILDTSSPFYTGILVPETPPRCDEGDEVVLCTQGETLAAVEEAIWGGRVGVGEGGGGWEEEGWDEDGWDEDEEVERMLGELWLGDE